MGVHIPATGTGDTTPLVATDKIAGVDYQQVKLVDGTVGGTQGAVVDSSGNLAVALKAASALLGASVANFPAVQPVSGYLGASVPNFPAVQPVSGSVSIVNLLNPQPVSGSVALTGGLVGASVSNAPQVAIASYSVTQPVTLASTSITQPVSGNVTASTIGYVGASVAGPVTASVIGYVGASVTNFPATQSIQGLVGASVSNFPGTQAVSGNVTASVIGYVGASITNTPSVSSLNVGGSVTSYPAAAAAGGASPYHYIAGASVNQMNVKSSAGTVYTLAAMNQNVSPRYLKLFDKSTVPSPGTDLPVQTYLLPGASAGAGAIPAFPVGLLFAAGIGFAITGGIGDTDQTATSANDVVVNLAFK